MADVKDAPKAPVKYNADKTYVAVNKIVSGTKKANAKKATRLTFEGGDELKGLPEASMQNLLEKELIVEKK